MANRFEKLKSLKSPVDATQDSPKTKTSSKRGGKSSDPDFHKLTVYISKDNLKKLKLACVERELDMSEIIDELLSSHLTG
ncbi:hypothetical protein [Picosynechococcus sp. NKBG15041c]|uniref:hypothetical protein n=1 Tax=Picosynechococcus sp. NKBG15041c TaxID=1407650 RepID=UPI00056F6A33|nr:hypothetical protein [Picosynechococcus sp. NKBG15041c]